MTDQWERDSWDYCSEKHQMSKDLDDDNKWRKCVSCGNASKDVWCSFCLEEE